MGFFEGFDFSTLWAEDSSFYRRREYPGDDAVKEIEETTGYKFPPSYLWLMQQHNGGEVAENNQGFDEILSVQDSYATYTALVGADTWDYPDIGMPVCRCPSDVHDSIFLDYRKCGKNGEPAVVHVDQEGIVDGNIGFEITHLSDSFEEFILSLALQKESKEATTTFTAAAKPKNKKLVSTVDVIAKILMLVGLVGGFILGLVLTKEIYIAVIIAVVLISIIAFVWIKIDDKLKKNDSPPTP